MSMTKKEAIENHKKMWNWIAEKTLERKRIVKKYEYFLENKRSIVPLSRCYCCEYDIEHSVEYPCSSCPIDFKGDNSFYKYFCMSKKSAFRNWLEAKDYTKRAELARQIANLPERNI